MSSDFNAHRGIVNGKTIELDKDTRLPVGQPVTVTLRPVHSADQKLPPGEGIRRSAGAWAEDADELDKFLEWNRQQRKLDHSAIENVPRVSSSILTLARHTSSKRGQ